jgi:hypothetical protein
VPPESQTPSAPGAPQPAQVWSTSSSVAPQVSPPVPQTPGTVRQPRLGLHDASQQPLPAAQVVVAAVHEHVPQLPAPVQNRWQEAG